MSYDFGRGSERSEATAYPFRSERISYRYAGADNWYLQLARRIAELTSQDPTMPNASVLVNGSGDVIGWSANGSDFHQRNGGCERVKQNVASGQGYELCEGCHPRNHSEPRAIQYAQAQGHDTDGAILYLWGHYWCCEPCCAAMEGAGVQTVVLLEGSDVAFDKTAPGNIVGSQFEATRPREPQFGGA